MVVKQAQSTWVAERKLLCNQIRAGMTYRRTGLPSTLASVIVKKNRSSKKGLGLPSIGEVLTFARIRIEPLPSGSRVTDFVGLFCSNSPFASGGCLSP